MWGGLRKQGERNGDMGEEFVAKDCSRGKENLNTKWWHYGAFFVVKNKISLKHTFGP